MAEEWEKYAILKNQFRRRSSTEFTGTGFTTVVHTEEVPKMLSELGGADRSQMEKTINQMDPQHTGRLDFQQYAKLCDRLVKEPTNTPMSMEFKSFNDFQSP